MIGWMRNAPLAWRLWISQSIVMALVVLAMTLAIEHYSASYLMTLMKEYKISPAPVHDMFTANLRLVALLAGIGAVVLAAALCFLVTAGIVGPLQGIVEMTGRVAAGDRAARLPESGSSEVVALSRAFNELTARLHQREEMQKSLIGSVAHELRTPLTNIRGYLEALTDDVLAPSKELFRSLHEETLLLTRVVENLFDLAEACSVAATLVKKPLDVQALLDRAIASCGPSLDAKQIQVERSVEACRTPVLADARIVQAVRNLIQNAVEHTPEQGRVEVRCEARPGEVRIVVSDNGEGIAAEDLPFIFDRFFRGHAHRHEEMRGAGLGLAIVKELVTAHGGQVGADPVENGARVWFTLPATA